MNRQFYTLQRAAHTRLLTQRITKMPLEYLSTKQMPL